MASSLFDDFPASSKSEWLQKIEKDLKGRPLSELEWEVAESLRVSPFAAREDLPQDLPTISLGRPVNQWEIGEQYFPVSSMKVTNTAALEGLQGGVEAIRWVLDYSLDSKEWEQLLAGIEPAYISMHLSGVDTLKTLDEQLFAFNKLWVNRSDRANLRGSFGYTLEGPLEEKAEIRLLQLIAESQKAFPSWRLFTIDAGPGISSDEQVIDELAAFCARTDQLFRYLSEKGIAANELVDRVQFRVEIGGAYFLNIAKLRALRLLLANVWQKYNLSGITFPPIETEIRKETQTEDANTNMIRTTTQAMSAVLGGADRLFLLPSDAFENKEGTSFSRRIARNVQHLLKMESHLDQVVDPAAGSYYLEHLTDLLARRAWDKYQAS
jgi:methylmalonyl-CoA mutase